MSGVQHIQITEDEEGMRLDRWFREHFPQLGHGQLQKLMRKGQVRLDGSRVKANDRVETGQSVRVPPLGEKPSNGKTTQRKETTISDRDRKFMNDMVLHRDKNVIVLNKPSGLAVQGGSGTKVHIDGLLPALVEVGAERPRLVHRLDKDTSGILVLAASVKAARALTASFRTSDARKLYWALVAGAPRPGNGKIDLALSKAMTQTRSGGREQMVAGGEDAKRAITYYETLDRAGQRFAWMALYPQTGRTHQLRVHMAEIGSPIIGDGKYGGEDAMPVESDAGSNALSSRLHLHARALSIPHPGGGQLNIIAPLRDHMRDSWKYLGFEENEYANISTIDRWPEFT